MQQARKPVFVEALTTQPSVERFDVGVLIGFAWLDQPQLHAVLMRPPCSNDSYRILLQVAERASRSCGKGLLDTPLQLHRCLPCATKGIDGST